MFYLVYSVMFRQSLILFLVFHRGDHSVRLGFNIETMDDILKLAKDYSKKRHLDLLPRCNNNILEKLDYTILVIVAFSQPQLTTKNEIGNPFWGSLSHFFVGAILQQHL